MVVKTNGNEAVIELSTRTKKISILKQHIQLEDEEIQLYRPDNAGGQSQYAPRGGFGGDRTMYGGASGYNGG